MRVDHCCTCFTMAKTTTNYQALKKTQNQESAGNYGAWSGLMTVFFFFFLLILIPTKRSWPRDKYNARVQVPVLVRAHVSNGWTLFVTGWQKPTVSEVTDFHCITQEILLLYNRTHTNNTSSLVWGASAFWGKPWSTVIWRTLWWYL